jgi:hypothetical protein
MKNATILSQAIDLHLFQIIQLLLLQTTHHLRGIGRRGSTAAAAAAATVSWLLLLQHFRMLID